MDKPVSYLFRRLKLAYGRASRQRIILRVFKAEFCYNIFIAEKKPEILEKEGGTDDSSEREQRRQNGSTYTGKGGCNTCQAGVLSPQRVRRQCEAGQLCLSDE